MTELIKEYCWPIVGAIVGLVFAILIITAGFLKTLLVVIFIAIGVVAGSYIKKAGILPNLFK